MKTVLLFAVLFTGLPALAQQLEVLTPKHRTAEELLPVLAPLVEKGGAITGAEGKLFLKASAANRAEIRKVLAALDRERRRLVISLMADREGRLDAAGGAIDPAVRARGGETAPGSAARKRDEAARARNYGTHRDAMEGVAQRVQVLEGESAFIKSGVSLPVPLHRVSVGPHGVQVSGAVVLRDLGNGFYARPSLQGEGFRVEIAEQRESLSREGEGAVRGETLRTTVSGRLGQWVELAGTDRDDGATLPGTKVYSTRGARERSRVLLKVEELQ